MASLSHNSHDKSYTRRITSQLKSVESTCPYRSLGGNISGHVTLRNSRNLPEESNGATECAVQICRNRQFPQLNPKNDLIYLRNIQLGAQGYSAVHVRLSLCYI